MSPDLAYILDIVHAARLIAQFKGKLKKHEFLKDKKTQSAIIHQILIVGEAVKRLSKEFRQKHPDIPWKMAAGMRDNLIHEYDEVDLNEVWKTITRDIPDLLEKLEPLEPTESAPS